MIQRRHATRPYFPRAERRDVAITIWLAFVVGAMCGATVALGVLL